MRFFINGFLAAVFVLTATSSNAAEQSIESAVNSSVLVGCLPNAMGVLDFTPQNSKLLDAAGLMLGTAIPTDQVLKLALQPNNVYASPKSFLNNVVLVPTPTLHMCRVGVFNSPTDSIRNALRAELTANGAPWKLAVDEVKGSIAMQSYEWQADSLHRFAINISGPVQSSNSDGLQLMITVAEIRTN